MKRIVIGTEKGLVVEVNLSDVINLTKGDNVSFIGISSKDSKFLPVSQAKKEGKIVKI